MNIYYIIKRNDRVLSKAGTWLAAHAARLEDDNQIPALANVARWGTDGNRARKEAACWGGQAVKVQRGALRLA